VFESSYPFSFFDYFRIPYQVRPWSAAGGRAGPCPPVHRLRATGQPGRSQRFLLWLAAEACQAAFSRDCRPGRYQLGDCTFFGHVAADAAVPAMLARVGGQWRCAEPVLDHQERHVASVWRDRTGSLFLPFDPNEVMHQFWSESYRRVGHSPLAMAGHAALRRGYYLARPALPRAIQLRLRRAFAQVQGRSSFPRWPVEDSLHDLYTWLTAVTAEVAGCPVPFIDLWPDGRSCALVLTHDVETEAGYRDLDLLRVPERELGYRSSWNFVGQRYRVDDETVRALHDEGCEVGVHGLRHDGRDLGSRRLMEKRLPAMRAYAERWDAVGFRSPATQRQWELMPLLGFEYDSSYTDTDPYEPQPGGCCTYLPYFNGSLVELPMTLPQDHTIFSILGTSDPDVWVRKARHLRERHAMVLALTHPDYARDPRVVEAYRRLLGAFRGDDAVWQALPSEVAAWWRQRRASKILQSGGTWRIEGPAAASGRARFAIPGTRQSPLACSFIQPGVPRAGWFPPLSGTASSVRAGRPCASCGCRCRRLPAGSGGA
jgi:peptidoglycan/xylan/chitin deacetylase (PgdA/CDA1 family)